MTHPLDDEDIVVTLALVHLPTGCSVVLSKHAPPDSQPDVSEVVNELGQQATDDLLSQLESR